MRRVSADDPSPLVLARVQPLAEKRVNFLGLSVREQPDHAHRETVVLLELRCCSDQGRDLQGFPSVRLPMRPALTGSHTRGDKRWVAPRVLGLAQRSNLPFVRYRIAERDNLWNATEVFDEPNQATGEGALSDLIGGGPPVEEATVLKVAEVLVLECSRSLHRLTNVD